MDNIMNFDHFYHEKKKSFDGLKEGLNSEGIWHMQTNC